MLSTTEANDGIDALKIKASKPFKSAKNAEYAQVICAQAL
jgi:hypothetical protein